MPNCARLGCAIALCATALAARPSFAASSATDAFMANIRLDAAYLVASSRLAATNAQSDAVKTYANAERTRQTDVLAALDSWQADHITDELQPKVASNDLQEGRSVAADDSLDVTRSTPPDGVGALMPAAAMTLEHLSTMKGAAFESVYREVDKTVLERVAGLCDAYTQTGDDPVLRDLARGELAKVRERLGALAKI